MFRKYKNRVKETTDVTHFLGGEVEKTIAYGKQTLFIVGDSMPRDKIRSYIESPRTLLNPGPAVEHIYLGANQSFDPRFFDYYDEIIGTFTNEEILVTLDYPVKYHEEVLESGYGENPYFISMISVPLPYTDITGYNSYIKLDDKGFAATNPGVWVHHLNSLKTEKSFTHWSAYKNDQAS